MRCLEIAVRIYTEAAGVVAMIITMVVLSGFRTVCRTRLWRPLNSTCSRMVGLEQHTRGSGGFCLHHCHTL